LKKNSAAMKTVYIILLAIIVTGVIVGAGTWFLTRPTTANALTIYTWWTSGGESAALNSLLATYEAQYPSVTVIPDAVAGGAGYVFKSVIKPLVLAGEAPDAFQVHAGYEMYPYVQGSYLASINSLWSSQGWTSVFPSVIASEVQWGGTYYAVPLDIHRANVIWYNKHILDANHIDPSTLTTWSAFFAACQQLSQNTTIKSEFPNWNSPIALGDTDQWETTMVWEEMLAGQGIQVYQNFINGNITNPKDPHLVNATRELAEYLNYTNANHASLTWDEAAALVITGQCAFNLMGDWNNGEFLVADKTYGVDYGTFAAPGTANMYGLVIDCFEHPNGVKDPTNSLNFLKLVGSVTGEMAFNPDKGSIPPRTDVLNNATLVAQFGPYQQAAIADYKLITSEGPAKGYYIYPSFVHGSGMPEDALTPFNTAFNAFVASARLQNSAVQSAAISTLLSAITSTITTYKAEFVKTWTLTG
jgi:glucose/mannose transport system substrate-binding protein